MKIGGLFVDWSTCFTLQMANNGTASMRTSMCVNLKEKMREVAKGRITETVLFYGPFLSHSHELCADE